MTIKVARHASSRVTIIQVQVVVCSNARACMVEEGRCGSVRVGSAGCAARIAQRIVRGVEVVVGVWQWWRCRRV